MFNGSVFSEFYKPVERFEQMFISEHLNTCSFLHGFSSVNWLFYRPENRADIQDALTPSFGSCRLNTFE